MQAGLGAVLADPQDGQAAAVLAALPASVRRVRWPTAAELPEVPPQGFLPGPLVVHRANLTATGAHRLKTWPRTGPVIVCHGPQPRAFDLDRWSGACDRLIEAALAPDIIGRYFRPTRAPATFPRVSVISDPFETRSLLVDALRQIGYTADPAREWSRSARNLLALWDVPVLEPDWPARLARRAQTRRIVALIGLPDPATVAQARAAGAVACLGLPYDEGDLAEVLHRLARDVADPAIPPEWIESEPCPSPPSPRLAPSR